MFIHVQRTGKERRTHGVLEANLTSFTIFRKVCPEFGDSCFSCSWNIHYSVFNNNNLVVKKNKFMWLFIHLLAVLGTRCYVQAFSSCGERASQRVGFSRWGAEALGSWVSSPDWWLPAPALDQRVWAQDWGAGLSCPGACGVSPDQGPSLWSLNRGQTLHY